MQLTHVLVSAGVSFLFLVLGVAFMGCHIFFDSSTVIVADIFHVVVAGDASVCVLCCCEGMDAAAAATVALRAPCGHWREGCGVMVAAKW